MAYIYIATNDTLWYNDGGHFTPLIKIGYTSSPDIDRCMEQLNRTTSAAGRFVKFASYELRPFPDVCRIGLCTASSRLLTRTSA